MEVTIREVVFLSMVVLWVVIRAPYELKAMRRPIVRSARSLREVVGLVSAFVGLGLIPEAYIFFGFAHFANYEPIPLQAFLGAMVAVSALMVFYFTHRALGSNWSASLDLRKNHRLVTGGIYRRVRHPMYSGFYLWAIAQSLLLPNAIVGFSGILGFGMLYYLRVKKEEELMLETFGRRYEAYMRRTKRLIPWVY